VHYINEIFPYQWKIALSWISGYFIFQIFNPVLFASEGAKVAGQMGLTLAAFNGIYSISSSWMTTKIPLFSTLISNKKYKELDSVFDKTLKDFIFINLILFTIFFIVIVISKTFNLKIGAITISDRFIPIFPMILMILSNIINQVVSAWATYLRCHKKEPYLINSIIGGILCAFSTIFFGKYFGIIGITLGYFILSIIFFLWAFIIFRNKRQAWHN
jgi:hypothetical protein